MPELVFHNENHIYELDGVKIPSVSEILYPLGDDIEEDLENVFEAAAERGTILHKVIELLLLGETEVEYPSQYESYVDAIRLFLSEHTITPIAIEKPVYHTTMLYGGTPDLLCEFDNFISILDYKFVAQVQKTKVKAQTNGYAKIYYDEGVDIEKLYVVQFLPDGNYRLYPIKVDDTEFDLCYDIYQLKNKKHPRGRIE